ncbi:MAG: hypothetical protein C4329_08690 [Chitinophagaceae bacterium]
MHQKFIAEVHFGKLAKNLRLSGFDTVYQNHYTNDQLQTIALAEGRVLLSRNKAFASKDFSFLAIYSEKPIEQLKQVLQAFELINKLQPFSRCLLCNGLLSPVAKEKVLEKILPNTIAYYQDFWQCNHCSQVYWKGSHYQRMMRFIEGLSTA